MKKAIFALIFLMVEKTVDAQSLRIGQAKGGGIVFYIDDTGEHGLIIAKEDEGTFDWITAKNKAKEYKGGGFTDWFLPTATDLDILKKETNASLLNVNLGNVDYWSSTETDANNAIACSFSSGPTYRKISKSEMRMIRVIRAF